MRVRLRAYLDRIRHRILYIPVLFVVMAIPLSQASLYLDRQIADERLPRYLETTVDSGRAILTSIAGGLIASITLLLSMMLIVVQLAGSQFSPRTTRDWLGDRSQQIAIGLVLGATVFCLLILREIRSFEESDALTPHLSVILSLVLGIGSLIAVVRSVDLIANGVRIGVVADRIVEETVDLIERRSSIQAYENPEIAPAARRPSYEQAVERPPEATPVCAPRSGWIQQISEDQLCDTLPRGATVHITAVVGGFTLPGAPVMWVWPPVDDEVTAALVQAVAIGDARTMQEDVGFGIVRLVDIAVRALSPGVNDPQTANDIIVNLGVVLLALWEHPGPEQVQDRDGRLLVRSDLTHADYLHASFDPIRRYGTTDPTVVITLLRSVHALRDEVIRRELPGPQEPLDEFIASLGGGGGILEGYSPVDRATIAELTGGERRNGDPGR